MRFFEETFCRLLDHSSFCPPRLQTFTEKTFTDRHKTNKLLRMFLPRKFPAMQYLCSTLYKEGHSLTVWYKFGLSYYTNLPMATTHSTLATNLCKE